MAKLAALPPLENIVSGLQVRAAEASAAAGVLRESVQKIDQLVATLISQYNPGWVFGPVLTTEEDHTEHVLFIGRYRGDSGIGIASRHPSVEETEFEQWLENAPVHLVSLAVDKIPRLLYQFDQACEAQLLRNKEAAQRAQALADALSPLGRPVARE